MKKTVLIGAIISFCFSALHIQAQEEEKLMTGLFGDTITKLPDAYQFSSSITMLLNSQDASKTNSLRYTLRFSDAGQEMALIPDSINGKEPESKACMVLNFETKEMITFMATEMTRIAMVYVFKEGGRMSLNRDTLGFGLVETGEQKEILNYTCRKYLFTHDDLSGELWLAKDLKSDQGRFLKFLSSGSHTVLPNPVFEKGTIMDYMLKDKEGNEITSFLVLEVKPNDPYRIETGGYVVSRLPKPEILRVF